MQYLNVTNQLREEDWYNPNSVLPKDEQKFIWDSIPLDETDLADIKARHIDINQNSKPTTCDDTSVNGGVDGTCKNIVNDELNWYKSEAVAKLKKCKANTPQKEIASYLKEIFKYWPSFDGYWKKVSIYFVPRVINWTINVTVREFLNDAILTTPVKYFSNQLKHRLKRKKYRNAEENNDTKDVK